MKNNADNYLAFFCSPSIRMPRHWGQLIIVPLMSQTFLTKCC